MGEFKVLENKVVQILIAIAIPNVGGVLLFALLANKIDENEAKGQLEPSYAPPGYVVGIAWTLLYTATGVASWRIWNIGREKKINVKIPLLFYTITLLINWLWPIIAFGLDSLLGAIIEMIILIIFVAITGILFYRIDKVSGLIYIPYAIYLMYATTVCIHIYILNN